MTLRVVIADDDPDIRALVRISVQRAGHKLVAELADGDDAWAAIHDRAPDLAILDVSMPGLSGIEICTLIRADETLDGVRVMLVSAAVDDASRERGLAAGAMSYISKPFSPRELVSLLSTIEEDAP
jgi:DNA-binding response OmpR family regulator